MTDYTYSVGTCESHHTEVCRFAFPANQKTYGEKWFLMADELAADYHDNHDGWEASWPSELRIYKRGEEVARFEVEREYEPTFILTEIAA